jgi:hypothetical protein
MIAGVVDSGDNHSVAYICANFRVSQSGLNAGDTRGPGETVHEKIDVNIVSKSL